MGMSTLDEGYRRLKTPLVPFNNRTTADGNAGGSTLVALTLAGMGTGDDFFNNYRLVLIDGLYRGWMADIVDYDETTGTFTINPALGEIIIAGTAFGLVAKWSLYNWILTGYDSSAIGADNDGSVMERLEYIQGVLDPFDISWIFGNLLIDADQFDVPDADANTERWTPEDIDGTEGVADIDTTTTDKLYMAILTPSMANEYAVARELPILMRHCAFQGDLDFTWGIVTATAMRGGILVSKSAAYDDQNMVRVYKEKSSGAERVVADAWFNNVAQTPAYFNTTDDELAFRIERNGNIYRCYYSTHQGDDIVWNLLTQYEDPTEFMTETLSCYYNIYSIGSAGTETIIMDVDNFYLFNTFGAFADRIGNPTEAVTGPGAAGSIHSKLRAIMGGLGIVAAAGDGLDIDGVTNLWQAIGVPRHFTATASAVGTLTDAALIDQAGLYVGEMVVPLTGNMAGQGRYITEYDGTQTITVLPAWPADPGSVEFIIIPSELGRILLAIGAEFNGSPDTYDVLVTGYTTAVTAVLQGSILERLEMLQDRLITGNATYTASASSVTTLTAAALLDQAGAYVGQMVIPLAGNMVGQGRYISAYDATQMITVTPPWPADPGSVLFMIAPSEESIVFDALAGAAGILAWPGPAVPAANVSMAEVLEYIVQAIGADFDGTPSIYTQVGPFSTYTTLGLDSLLEWLGLPDTANYHSFYEYIVTGANTALYPNIAANADGSVLERLEFVQSIIGNTVFESDGATTTTITCDEFADVALQYIGQVVIPLGGAMLGEGRYITAYNGTTMITVSPPWGADPDAGGNIDFVIMPSGLGVVYDALMGANGLLAWPAAAIPAANVSIAEVINYIYSEQFGTEFDGSPDLYDTIVSGYTTAAVATAVGSLLERIQLLQEALIGNNTIFTSSAATVNTVTAAALVDRDDLYVGQMLVPLTGNQAGQGRYITAYDDTETLTVAPDWSTDPDAAGAFTFVIMPTPIGYVDKSGHGLVAIFNIVDSIPVLTRVGGVHDQSDAASTEDIVWTIDAPGGNWVPKEFHIDLTEMAAADDLTVQIYYRLESGGAYVLRVVDRYLNAQAVPLEKYDLSLNRFGMKISTTQDAGVARDWPWENFYEG